ncbi:MAG: hypothetical protein JST30_13925 [Armatimonadetes bacterium]|nr:hypothetical protein [Armatimonadota bacterium]
MRVKEGFVPVWRRRRRSLAWIWTDRVMAVSSVASAVALSVPEPGRSTGLNEAISLSLSRGHWAAVTVFLTAAAVLSLLAFRLGRHRRWGAAVFLALDVLLLAVIALTNPLSDVHQLAFIGCAVATTLWLFLIAWEMDEPIVKILASGATVGAVTSVLFVGLGERILVACCLGGGALLYFNVFDMIVADP